MKNILNKSILFLALFLLLSMITYAGNYTWTGSTSTVWSTATNWSPAQVPSTNDTVTIVTGSNNTYLSGNTTVKVFTINSGTVDMRGYKFKITGGANFNSGTITNGQLGLSGTSDVYFSGTLIDAVTKVSDHSVFLNGSTFSDSLTVVKKGDPNDNSKGGNTFNGYVSLVDSSVGAMVLSDSFPDIFNSILSVNNVSSGGIYLAHRGTGNQFNGNVTFLGSKIYSNYYGTATYSGNITISTVSGEVYFGYSSGSCSLISGKTISLSGPDFSSGNLYFRNFTQLDTTTTISLTLLGSSHLYFESGSSFNAPVTCSAPLLYLDGTKFYRTTSLTNTGSSNVTSTGGCYFGGLTTINNNPASSITYSLANTTTDTFATTATIQNSKGVVDFNNGLLNGNVTLKNLDSSDTNVRFYVSNSGATKFKGTLTIDNHGSNMVFGKSGGTTILDSSQVISFVSGFSGTIQLAYFSQRGSTNQSFIFPGSGSELALGPSSSFDGGVTFYGQNINLNGVTFNDTTSITRYGTSGNTSNGGNIFNSTTTILDSSSGSNDFIMASISTDDFNGDVTFIQKGTGVNLYPSYTKNSTFAGNITVDGSSVISFGANGGKAIIDGSSSQSINNSGSYTPSFKKIEVNKSGGALTLNTPLSISDSLILLKGIINSDTTNIITLANGGIATNASDSSFVNGPFKKIGNATFIFPIGYDVSNGYHPLEITAPSSTTDAYTAQYFHIGQSLGSTLDTTIENLSACQYWSLTRNTGTSKVRIKLNWNYDSCGIIDPQYMRIAGWNGSLWKDFSSYAYSGDSLKGSSTSLDSTTTINIFTLSNKRCIYFSDKISSHDVFCHGGADGISSVSVYGGTPPYYYNWSGNMGTDATTPMLLYAGQFNVSISDTLGCHLSDSTIIHEPDSLTITFSTSNYSSCGDSTGVVTAFTNGGTGVLKKYFWTNDGTTDQTHSNLPAGEYTVLVTDSNACAVFGTVQVSDNDGPVISLDYVIPVTCFAGADGRAVINVSSSLPYKAKWSTSVYDTLDSISNVHGGFYTVRITDSIGCISFDTIEVTQPDTFAVTTSVTNTRCGEHEGVVTATVVGGTADYTYSWSPDGPPPDSIITNLNSGTGTVTVTDGHGCLTSADYEILDIYGITVTGYVIADVPCFGDSSGSARVTVSGGTAPYTYSWYPSGGDDDTAINLIPNYYRISVIDANGCRQKTYITVSSPEELKAYIFSTNADYDSSNGSASSIVYGGTPPYSYSWSNGSHEESLTGLNGGNDTLVVTDNNGCTDTNAVRIRSVSNLCFNGTNTLHNNCSPYTTFSCSSCTTIVSRNIKDDFFAVGDGVTDDECAFENASYFFSQVDPLVPKFLIIPNGTYMVGRQDFPWPSHGNDVLYFNNLQNMHVIGKDNAILKFQPCMQYGTFDIPNGNTLTRYIGNPYGCPTCATSCPACTTSCATDISEVATPGNMIHITGCKNVWIENLELDGNIDNTIIGGGYTEGIQIPYDGIEVFASNNVTLDNLNVHHFGHDGLYVAYDYCIGSYRYPFEINPNTTLFNQIGPMNMVINKCKFTYNARTGMVWAGGYGLSVINSSFNYTGESRLVNSKSFSGVDIEYEAGSNMPNSNGLFKYCNFEFNKWCGMVCDANQPPFATDYYSRHVKFLNDTFITSENGLTAWPNSRDFLFDHCAFYGSTIRAYNSPLAIPHGTIFTGNGIFIGMSTPLVNHNDDNTKFRSCEFDEDYPDITHFFNTTSLAHSYSEADDFIPHTSVPDPGCPNTFHTWLIDFSNATRVEITGCTMISGFTENQIAVSGYTATPNIRSYNLMGKDNFYSCGLNGCNCEIALLSIGNVEFLDNQVYFYNPGGLVNSTGSCTYTSNPNSCSNLSQNESNSVYASNQIFNIYPNAYTNTWHFSGAPGIQNCAYSIGYGNTILGNPFCPTPKYYDTHDPNEVDDLFSMTCPITVPPTYPPGCFPDHSRLRNPDKNQGSGSFTCHPNPTSDYLFVENAKNDIGKTIKICNIIGKIVFEKKVDDSSFQVDIKFLQPGFYFVFNESNQGYKFIKL